MLIKESGYTLPSSDYALTHSRILHAGNWAVADTITVSSTDSDYFADAPDNSLTYEKWKPSTAASESWEASFSAAKDLDCCGIAAHDLGTQAAAIKVQSWTGSAWSDRTASTLISNNEAIFVIFEPVNTTKIRLLIESATAAPFVGVVKFGEALQMPRPTYADAGSPASLTPSFKIVSTQSHTGEMLGRTKYRKEFNGSLKWSNLEADWVRDNWPLVQNSVTDEPFFVAWRPDGDFSNDVQYAQCDKIPSASIQGQRNLMTVAMKYRCLGYD